MTKTCFGCKYADIDPGYPDVHYLSNGDPGYPGEPPCAYCQDPLARNLREKYLEFMDNVFCELSRADFPIEIRRSIENTLNFNNEEGFAQQCPMFHQATSTCRECKKEFNGKEEYCYDCEAKIMGEPC